MFAFTNRFALRGAVALTALTVALLATPQAHAQTWAEIPDAGQLPGTAQNVEGTGPLTAITGTIVASGHADMYRIYITDPGLFSATTVGQPGTLTDTQLFLFDNAGMGVYANDDASGTLRSTLPAGNANGPMSAGLYFLAISGFDADPVSAGGQIFPDTPFEGVFAPTGPGGGSAITGWSGSSGTGTYQIALTGANYVPEPTSMALLGSGLVGLVAKLRRRKTEGETVEA